MARHESPRTRRKTSLLARHGVSRATSVFDGINTQGQDVASASTISLTVGGGVYIRVTGTVTINAIAEQPPGERRLVLFTGILTITHNATSLILPGGSNITTYAGYTAEFMSLGDGNWRMLGDNAAYQPLDATLTALAGLTIAANSLILGTGADAFSDLVISANTFPARASSGNVVATPITDAALTVLDDATVGAMLATLGGQPLDSDLTTIAGLTATTDNFIVSVASAWASRTPSQVRTTLGLVIGTNVQAWDADLDTIAGLTATTDNFMVAVSSAWASRTPTQVKSTLGLVIGTNVQAWDADLDALAALSGTHTIYYRSAANTWSAVTVGTGLDFTGANLTCTVSGVSAANPTASIAGPAINGVATTYMRSDAVPALAATITQAETIQLTDAATNSVSSILTLTHLTSGTTVAGFGSSLVFKYPDHNGALTTVCQVVVSLLDNTFINPGTDFNVVLLGASLIRAQITFSGGYTSTIGFLGATPAAAQTGDVGTALVTFGLMSGTPTFAEANVSFTDITTNNASTSKHGFLPKLDNSAGHFLNGQGAWATPGGAGDALKADPLSQFAATTSAQLAGVISDETGSGLLVFATSPTLTTPLLGTPTSGVLTNCTGLPATSVLLSAATAAYPALADLIFEYNNSAAANRSATLSKVLGQASTSLCEGRLTLTSGTALTTANVTGATSIYFALYNGDRITIYDGTGLRAYSFTELTLALGTVVTAQAYDVFIYDSAGTLTLESLEWANSTATCTSASPGVWTWTAHGLSTNNSVTFTNSGGALPTGVSANTQYWLTKIDANTFKISTTMANLAAGTFVNTSSTGTGTHTAHSPALRATALVAQNGEWYKTGALTRRYLGSFVATSTTATEDSTANRYVFNAHNRKMRTLLAIETTDTWNYTLTTWRQANATDANRINFFVGLNEDPVDSWVLASGFNSGNITAGVGVGLDSTGTNSANLMSGGCNNLTRSAFFANYKGYPGVGLHSLVWLEVSAASGTTTWSGDAGLVYIQCGIQGTVWC